MDAQNASTQPARRRTRRSLFGGTKATIDGRFVQVSRLFPTVKKIRVPRSAVETVTVNSAFFGRSKLELVGRGAVLASIRLPRSTAERLQAFLLEELTPPAGS